MNDHRAIIVGVCEATRTFQSNPVVYTLYSRAKQFVPRSGRSSRSSWSRPRRRRTAREDRRRRSSPSGSRARPAWGRRTSEKFIYKTIKYYLIYTGIPINFGITAFLGFLVGTAIAGQTFYNFTIENLKQFGALKAMGASNLPDRRR